MTAGSGNDRADGDALRDWGRAHPFVREVFTLLSDADASTVADGLVVDADPAPWIHIAGETRVSILRLVSVTPTGRALVGQIQVTLNAGTRTLRAYAHDPDVPVPAEETDAHAWWLRVLDAHYARGGTPLALPAHATA